MLLDRDIDNRSDTEANFFTVEDGGIAFNNAGFFESFETPLTSTPSFYPPTLDDARTALSGFGQGDVTATPLQIVMMSAAIANDGVVMAPTMIDRVIAPDLAIEFETVASEVGRAVDKKNNETLVSMMTANVANGAAGGARIE